MEQWQKSLDRWLTTEPEDSLTPWWEKFVEAMPQATWDELEEDDKWIESMFDTFITNKLSQAYAPDNRITQELYFSFRAKVKTKTWFENYERGKVTDAKYKQLKKYCDIIYRNLIALEKFAVPVDTHDYQLDDYESSFETNDDY